MNHPARRISAAVLAAALTVTLAACGDGNEPGPRTAPTASPSPTETSDDGSPLTENTSADSGDVAPSDAPTAGFDKDGNFDVCAGQTKPFTGEAAKVFGAENVMDAYCEFLDMELRLSYTSMMTKSLADLDAGAFYPARQYLTSSAQKEFDETVEKALAGDEDAHTSLTTFYFVDVEDPGSGYVLNEFPYVLERQWSPASTVVDKSTGRDRLGIRFTLTGDIRMLKNGKPIILPVTKDLTFYAVPYGNAENPWLIDDWKVTITGGTERADKTKFTN